MTKFEQILYKEKMEAVNEAVNRAVDENAENIAENLLRDGLDIEFVSRNTGLDLAVVEAIAQRIANEQTANAAIG